jgi:hypothetical protein
MSSLVVLNDVILPDIVLTAGVRGRQIRKNERTETISGAVSVNIDWDQTLREFEVGYVPMLPTAWQALEGLYEVTDAGAYGFLMLDPKDSQVPASAGLLRAWNAGFPVGTAGQGYGEPAYQMFRRITSVGTTRTKDRKITRPLTPVVLRNGNPVTVGSGAGNISINADTGRVTFVADTTQNMSAVTIGSTTVLTFAADSGVYAASTSGDRVYLTGITGTAASTLNGRSHAITAKSVSSPYTLTISTNTTGLSASGGMASRYPQASDTLSWSGRFYVPVHFANDVLDWELLKGGPVDGRLVSGPQAVIREVLE